MRTARGFLVFVAIIALLALTIGPTADLLPFDISAPVWFVFAAVLIIFRCRLLEDLRPHAALFVAANALRAPPLA